MHCLRSTQIHFDRQVFQSRKENSPALGVVEVFPDAGGVQLLLYLLPVSCIADPGHHLTPAIRQSHAPDAGAVHDVVLPKGVVVPGGGPHSLQRISLLTWLKGVGILL